VWIVDKPHKIDLAPETSNGLGNHNYCRNPDGSEEKPWCYTTDPSPDKEKELCEVPICPGLERDYIDEANSLSEKMAPSFDCDCMKTLHDLMGSASFVQLMKVNETAIAAHLKNNAASKKGKVVHGKCVCN